MQKNAKRILGWLLLIIALPFLIYFGFNIKFDNRLGEVILKNHELEQLFKDTAYLVDQFIKQNQRLPNDIEFETLVVDKKGHLSLNGCAEPLPEKMGDVPKDSYYLGLWRGEWCEFYTHWNQQTTLSFDKSSYYPFRSKILTWFFFILSWLMVLLAIHLIVKSSPINLTRV